LMGPFNMSQVRFWIISRIRRQLIYEFE
jgi:hypothetical protein